MGAGHPLPRFAPVEGAVQAAPVLASATSATSTPAASPRPPGRARIRLDQRVDHVPVLAKDIDPDPPLVALRQPLGELRPALPAIDRAVEAAPRTAPVETPPRALPLVHRGEDRVGVARVHRKIDRARVLVDVEDLLPGLTPVLRAEDAALLVRPPQVAHRRHVHHVRIARMDQNAPDVLRPLQPHVLPAPPAVGRLVDAVAPAGGLAVLRLAGADPHEVRVRLVEGDIADRTGRLVVEERRPGGAVVLGLPDAAGAGGDVEDLRLRLDDGEVGDPPAHQRRTELAVLEVRDGGFEGGLGGGAGRGREGCGGTECCKEALTGLHGWAPGFGTAGGKVG